MSDELHREVILALMNILGPGERTKPSDMSPIDPASGGCIHWLYDLGTADLGDRWVVPGYDDGSIQPYALRFEADSGSNFVTVVEWPESKLTDLLGRLLFRWEFSDLRDELN